jgi:hypothetical protein
MNAFCKKSSRQLPQKDTSDLSNLIRGYAHLHGEDWRDVDYVLGAYCVELWCGRTIFTGAQADSLKELRELVGIFASIRARERKLDPESYLWRIYAHMVTGLLLNYHKEVLFDRLTRKGAA